MLLSSNLNLPLSMPCPCGSGQLLVECCAPYLQGQRSASTAEKLMRSRYSAYFTKNIDYLINTHHPSRRESNSRDMITATANSVTWLGLFVLETQAGQPEDKTGVVEFVALFQEKGRETQLRERSQFLQQKSQWFYLDGDILSPLQPKRNEPCWCNSGKKFKQCHGKK